MAEKPILFSGEMVRAILDGRKTITRRVVNFGKDEFEDSPHYWPNSVAHVDGGGNWIFWSGGDSDGLAEFTKKAYPNGEGVRCPYGRPGDLLWVRETWQAQNMHGQWYHEVPYAERSLHFWAWTNPINPAFDAIPPQWLPSIHMPRWASRITLRVCDVRVERVQDIKDRDSIAEGIKVTESADLTGLTTGQPTRDFRILWDSINAKRGYGWDVNPWVWVVSFEVVR